MTAVTPDSSLSTIADQIEARAITEQPLTIAEMARLAAQLRTIALVIAARQAADQVEAELHSIAERQALAAERILAETMRPPGAIAPPRIADPSGRVLSFPRRHRAHADAPDGAA